MGHVMDGTTVLGDERERVTVAARLVLETDHRSVSRVIIESLDGDRREEFRFGANNWHVLEWLMLGILEVNGYTIDEAPAVTRETCTICHGTGGGEDADGNWIECPTCHGW